MLQLRFSLSAAVLAALVGCGGGGPSVSYVEGRVTLDGTPVSKATVVFSPVEGGTGRPAVGTTDEAGVFKLTDTQSDAVGSGAAAGEYRVGITKVTSSGSAAAATENDETAYLKTSPTGTVAMKSEIPTTYNRPESSGLTATVQSGRNENLNFELKSAP